MSKPSFATAAAAATETDVGKDIIILNLDISPSHRYSFEECMDSLTREIGALEKKPDGFTPYSNKQIVLYSSGAPHTGYIGTCSVQELPALLQKIVIFQDGNVTDMTRELTQINKDHNAPGKWSNAEGTLRAVMYVGDRNDNKNLKQLEKAGKEIGVPVVIYQQCYAMSATDKKPDIKDLEERSASFGNLPQVTGVPRVVVYEKDQFAQNFLKALTATGGFKALQEAAEAGIIEPNDPHMDVWNSLALAVHTEQPVKKQKGFFGRRWFYSDEATQRLTL
jgi:hypothetical protein